MTTSGYKPLPLTELNSDLYGGKKFNVAIDYDWTLAPKTSEARTRVPIMHLKQFEMDSNALISNLKYWVTPIFDKNSNPYKGLYSAKPTEVEFIFPWFEEFHHNISQNWDDFKGLETSTLFERITKGLSLLTNSPGIAINTPKVWKSTNRATVPYSITLFNTTKDPDSSIRRNRTLINRLIASTLHDQKGPVLVTPPAIYELYIPGVRYSPACTISNLEISNIGTLIKRYGDAVPEAYRIKFSVNELISESRQIFDAVAGGPGGMSARNRITSIVSTDSNEANNQNSVVENQANQNNLGLQPGQEIT